MPQTTSDKTPLGDAVEAANKLCSWRLTATKISLALAILIALREAGRTDTLDRRLIGAWVLQSSDCKKVVESRAGHLDFRRPVDRFSLAHIIGPQKILSSDGECRVGKISNATDAMTIAIDCNDSAGFVSRTVHIKMLSDTKMTYSSADDPDIKITYEKCP